MNVEEKLKSVNDEFEKKLKPIKIKGITEEQRKEIAVWVSNATAIAYDRGYKDGQRK